MILLVAASLTVALFAYGFILDFRARRRGEPPKVFGRYAGARQYHQRAAHGGSGTDAGGFIGGGCDGGGGGDCA